MNPTTVLEHAPMDLAGLAGWFPQLTMAQFRRVWVAAVADCVSRGDWVIALGELILALQAVRDRYDGPEERYAGTLFVRKRPASPGAKNCSSRTRSDGRPDGRFGPRSQARRDAISVAMQRRRGGGT